MSDTVDSEYISYSKIRKNKRQYRLSPEDKIINVHAFIRRRDYDRMLKEYDDLKIGLVDNVQSSVGKVMGEAMIVGFEILKKEHILKNKSWHTV